jgi:hypothetical protein
VHNVFMVFGTDIFFKKFNVKLLCSIAPNARIRVAKEFQNEGEDILPKLKAIFVSGKRQEWVHSLLRKRFCKKNESILTSFLDLELTNAKETFTIESRRGTLLHPAASVFKKHKSDRGKVLVSLSIKISKQPFKNSFSKVFRSGRVTLSSR